MKNSLFQFIIFLKGKWQGFLRNEFICLFRWIIRRFFRPLQSVNFFSYLIVGAGLCGGSGIWILFLLDRDTVSSMEWILSICSFATATIGITYLDTLFNKDANAENFVRGFSAFSLASVVIFVLIAIFKQNESAAYLAAVLSFLFLWLINADRFKEMSSAQTPSGGEVETPISGKTEGYKV